MQNQSKPTTSISNNSKISIGETWATITSTWATELRSWLAVSQLLTNYYRPTQGYLWSASSFPWLEPSPWDDVYGGITNQAKP